MISQSDMIEDQLKARGIHDPAVLQAMQDVDRTLFIHANLLHRAYEDGPLPIGKSQTISQPFIVAYMAQVLELNADAKVLEIGTGCGYNAAVLAQISTHVYSIEIIESLHLLAKKNLAAAGVYNVHTRLGDGIDGWPDAAPFDAIVLTAAPYKIPESLKLQLKVKGILLAPKGRNAQKLVLTKRQSENEFITSTLMPVCFVPMTGKAKDL
ncbi:protein-L-isoaspartate(D-aspartate) O-methyltransferase [Aquiflexum sp.]|uniref:protein-L-isoaspartate(D-aspartate) O-methyltransferase n=1 Tax=Aquiflexum sp. TaxID=1872584 RepID=UPI003593CA1F